MTPTTVRKDDPIVRIDPLLHKRLKDEAARLSKKGFVKVPLNSLARQLLTEGLDRGSGGGGRK